MKACGSCGRIGAHARASPLGSHCCHRNTLLDDLVFFMRKDVYQYGCEAKKKKKKKKKTRLLKKTKTTKKKKKQTHY
eukprot:NODE_32372_length_376_cov_2.425703.p1 GENE.NODE_32372_length_376_cov_2.425703~~NODE_32372_length_376_cov_2.425703.p1  ORF type:complete len:77 (-),score=31.08 NODE_32372_length_376_cov_2.425703:79-309(-)